MNTSPTLRLSLRRKRSTRYGENSGSPAIKKSSPTLPETNKESPSTPKSYKSQRLNNRLTRSGSRLSSQVSQVKSTDKDDYEEKTLETPATTTWTHSGDDSLRQPSPDMPFISSQLCSTQECEVVWDCDSPGFTKDDLKRRHSGKETEVPDRPVQIPQLPHRQLFPLTRSRASRASTLGNTTSQLNDLLDFLSSKDHAGRKEKEKVEDPNSCHKTIQHIIPLKSNLSEDGSSSESPGLLEPLKEASSQPFEVHGASIHKESDQNLPSDIDDSLWGDDLNLGMCDINDTVLTEQGINKISSEGARVASMETDRPKLPQETANLSSASNDIFDDDLFSDSVILSTQAVEEAMTKKDANNITNNRNYSCASFSKETHHRFNNTLPKDGHKYEAKDQGTNNCMKITNGTCNKSQVSTHKVITNSANTNNRINPSIDRKQTSLNSNSSPRRQVRRSFRFGSSPKSAAKRDPSLVTEKSNQSLISVPENQILFRNREARGELRKDSLPVLSTEKSSIQNSSTSHLMSKRLSGAPASWNNLNTQMTKTPIVRKSLFRNNNTKSEEVKHSIQASRGPLLRSQSSGDTRITTSSPVGRRSNSSVEFDTSQDLDDDEFFKSLLSMLPEEEGGFCTNPGPSLSPIKPDNQFSNAQMSVKLSNTHITGNRVEVRNSRATKKEACIAPQNCNMIPRQNPRNVPTQNQRNVPTQNRNIPSQNICSIPSQNLINVPSNNLCNIPSQNLHNAPPQKTHNAPPLKTHNAPLLKTHNAPPPKTHNAPPIKTHSAPPLKTHSAPPLKTHNAPPLKTHSALSQGVTNAPPHSFVSGSVHTTLDRKVNQQITKSKVDPSVRKPTSLAQGVRPPGSYSSTRTKPLDTNKARVGDEEQEQTNDTFDDGLFQDDVLSLIDEVESQFGSQNAPSEPTPSPQSPQPQQVRCSQDEIAQKKAAALRRREERRKQCR